MAPLQGIQPGDIVRVDKRGRVFLALVTEKHPGKLRISPIVPNINYFEATSREVKDHWRKMGRRRDQDV